jgi:2-dehydro-3-deoxy-D-pentonate aldolase
MVPLDSQGEINEAELRRYTDWLIDRGVHGLYPNGSTGEFTRFTPDERRRTIEIVVDQARGRVPVLAGAAEANTRETIRACERYHELGVRAVAIVSPFYYKLGPSSVYAYFREIGRNTPVDVTLYNIPMFASPIDVPTVQRLADELPKIVAIKDSSSDLSHMMRMIQAVRPNRPDFAFLTGWDPMLFPSLLIGCDGGTHATSGVVPELTRKLFDLSMGGRIDDARELQYRLLTLFDAIIYSAEFPEGVRAALEVRGFRMGRGRQPMGDDQQIKVSRLADVLGCILSAEGFGFVDEPAAGCPPRLADHDTDQISQIVAQVVSELKNRGAIP